jgi:hypothetical protein
MKRLIKDAHAQRELAIHIIEKAKTFGASLAGLADINTRWPADGRLVLVIAFLELR